MDNKKDCIFLDIGKHVEPVSHFRWLENKSILVTGGSGVVGSIIVYYLYYIKLHYNLNLKIIVFVRNAEKANNVLTGITNGIDIIVGDVTKPIIFDSVDYIVHCAAQTASKEFVEHPVETISTAVNGTINILKFAKETCVKRIVYLSSMEVYGAPTEGKLLREADLAYMDCLRVRNYYPESKRMSENICISYYAEYGVPVIIARLAQTFGLATDINDARVFAEFARCVIEGNDIILKTDGSSKRMYIDTVDAVRAILTLLVKGMPGEAYNVANKGTYCSVLEMAEMVSRRIAHGRISVKREDSVINTSYFPPPHMYNLETSKIEALGWRAMHGLDAMYERLLYCYAK